MKFFSWMQSKFSAGDGNKRDQKNKETPNEEFINDWPNGLLAIGTLGYKDHMFKHETFELVERSLDTGIPREEECSSPDFSEFTSEEVRSLQKELTKLLRQNSASKVEETEGDLPLDKFLNCPSSLEIDLDSDNKVEGDIDRIIKIILGRCKDASEKKRSMGRKSLRFFIKKMFVCRSGFDSTPSLRDTFQETRMEKLMRAMMTKKIHPRNFDGVSSTTKCIEDYRLMQNAENEERLNEINYSGFKWDKTDSEFIVLDI